MIDKHDIIDLYDDLTDHFSAIVKLACDYYKYTRNDIMSEDAAMGLRAGRGTVVVLFGDPDFDHAWIEVEVPLRYLYDPAYRRDVYKAHVKEESHRR